MTKEQIINNIKKFEIEFNEEKIIETQVTFISEKKDSYICDVTIFYEGKSGTECLEITKSKYPKDIIDKI